MTATTAGLRPCYHLDPDTDHRCSSPAMSRLEAPHLGLRLEACGEHSEPWWAAWHRQELPAGFALSDIEQPALEQPRTAAEVEAWYRAEEADDDGRDPTIELEPEGGCLCHDMSPCPDLEAEAMWPDAAPGELTEAYGR